MLTTVSVIFAFACRESILVISELGIPPLSSCLVYRSALDQPALSAMCVDKGEMRSGLDDMSGTDLGE